MLQCHGNRQKALLVATVATSGDKPTEVQAPPKQTSSKSNNPVEEPPKLVKRVYVKEHGTKGLDAQYRGPFPVISRPTRTTVKVRIGFYANGEERYQVQHWRDLKVEKKRSEDTIEAARPKLGRPKKSPTTSVTSEAATTTELAAQTNDALEVNKPSLPPVNQPVENKPAEIQTTERSVRSMRKPKTLMRGCGHNWSASSGFPLNATQDVVSFGRGLGSHQQIHQRILITGIG